MKNADKPIEIGSITKKNTLYFLFIFFALDFSFVNIFKGEILMLEHLLYLEDFPSFG